VIFAPKNEKLWDTWVIERGGIFYLFYIRISGRVTSGPRPSLGEGWDGISLATSTDLIHWDEIGPVLEKHPDAAWLGTGMIHRLAAGYIMNFSEERPRGVQVISFATSDDLQTWKRLPASFDLYADGDNYQAFQHESADPLPRWDSLGVVAPRDGENAWTAFVCANTRKSLPGQCGTLGLLTSDDGLHWTCMEPATEPGLFPSYEVPEHVSFGDRHYVLFSTNSTAGTRFDDNAWAAHSGTYYVVADQLRGPYRRPTGDALLQGHRGRGPMLGTYVGRPLVHPSGELLFYHQWTADYPNGSWGPPKLLVETEPWVLGLRYWAGCDALKGRQLRRPEEDITLGRFPPVGHLPVVDHCAEGSVVRIGDLGGAGASQVDVFHRDADERVVGRVVEATITGLSGRAVGLWVGYRDDDRCLAVSIDFEHGLVEIGHIAPHPGGSSMTFERLELARRPLRSTVDVRLMFRGHFLEFYIDDALVCSFSSLLALDPARLGVYSELAVGRLENVTVWEMP
jgi:hypothetical protein